MLKQSEFFILVIKGIWVLSGITDRKHPQHFSTSDKYSAKADCHYGEQNQESAGLTAPRPQMRNGGGAACSADLVCGGVIHPRPTQNEMPAFRPHGCVECLSPQTPSGEP